MFIIRLTEAELQALSGLLDAGVRAAGLRSVKDAAGLLEKLEAAARLGQQMGEVPIGDQPSAVAAE